MSKLANPLQLQVEEKPNALSSFYGQGHVDATRTRECVAMPGKRNQVIYTPEDLLECVRYAFGGRIMYDPCSGPDSIVDAAASTECDGLTHPWYKHSFANVPFGTLKEWLAKSVEEIKTDHIMLVPVRPHRKWWREWANRVDLIFLNPVKFRGYKQAFPAPLCMSATEYGTFGRLRGAIERAGLGGTIS